MDFSIIQSHPIECAFLFGMAVMITTAVLAKIQQKRDEI